MDIGQQGQDAVLQVAFDNQGPQFLMGFWQAELESAHFEVGQSGTPGMMKGSLVSSLPGHTIDQVLQVLGFPTIEPGVVDFHQAFQVGGSDNG